MSIPTFLRSGRFGLSLVAAASLALAAGRNIAPDAITRATTWNEHSGDVAVLTDGIVPPDSTAQAFVWSSKGVLAFDWDPVTSLDRVRVRTGTVSNDFQVRVFDGGYLTDEGATRAPEGEQTARIDNWTRRVDDWVEIELPDGTQGDNIEVRNLGPAELYEIEILTSDGTAVTPTSWAAVKATHAAQP